MQVVGFAGPARVGKTYATEALKKEAEAQGWHVVVLPFAGPLKEDAVDAGFAKNVDPEGYRKFCQEHGAFMRSENPNHWLQKWALGLKTTRNAHFADDKSEKPLLIIADDVRYENELEAVRKGGGYTFFLRPGQRELEDASAEWRTHESEMLANTMVGDSVLAKQEFDFVVVNNQDAAEMVRWAKSCVQLLIAHPGDDSTFCDCEGCNAALENRPVNADTIMKELEDLMEDINGLTDKEDDDE